MQRSACALYITQQIVMRQAKEPRYCHYLTALDTRLQPSQLSAIRTLHSSLENTPSNAPNPLVTTSENIASQQLPLAIAQAVKTLNQPTARPPTLTNLAKMVEIHRRALIQMNQKDSEVFSLLGWTVAKVAQEMHKAQEWRGRRSEELVPLVDLFCEVLQARTGQRGSETKGVEHWVFRGLLVVLSVRYVRDLQEEDYIERDLILRALRGSELCAYFSKDKDEYEVVREILAVTSHLLVFNGERLRPIRVAQFSLEQEQGLFLAQVAKEEVPAQTEEKYLTALRFYIKVDAQLQVSLQRMLGSLLSLQIGNQTMYRLYSVLIFAVKERVFPRLAPSIFLMLRNAHSKKSVSMIDRMLTALLNSVDLSDDEVQRLTLGLLTSNPDNEERMEVFARLYFQHYRESKNRLLVDTINALFSVVLELELSLPHFELLVKREASYLSPSSLQTLLRNINQTESSLTLTLLEIILEQRRKQVLEENSKTVPFLQKQWFDFELTNPDIPRTYLRVLGQGVVGRSLEVNPSLINIGGCIVRMNEQLVSNARHYYLVMLEITRQAKLFEVKLFRHLLLCQAVLGNEAPVNSFCYFSQHFASWTDSPGLLLTYLEYLIMLLKNKASTILYLQALLSLYQQDQGKFLADKLYDIGFLARLASDSQYFRVNTYSPQAVAILYELQLLIKQNAFRSDLMTLLNSWSGLITPYQAKSLTYLFSHRQITQVYPCIPQKASNNPRQRIVSLWKMLIELLDYQPPCVSYLPMRVGKEIRVTSQQPVRSGLKITFTLICNSNTPFLIQLILSTSQAAYELRTRDHRLILTHRPLPPHTDPAQVIKQLPLKELKSNPQSVTLNLFVDLSSQIFELRFGQGPYLEAYYEGQINSVLLNLKGQVFVKEWKVCQVETKKIRELVKEGNGVAGSWLVQANTEQRLEIDGLARRFSFDHAYCLIGQMLKNIQQIDLVFAYDTFISLSVRLFKSLRPPAPRLSSHLLTMTTVFSVLEKAFSRVKQIQRPLSPRIELENPEEIGLPLYHLLVSAILPRRFWKNLCPASQQRMMDLLTRLVDVRSFILAQNREVELYYQVCRLASLREEAVILAEKLLMAHEPNSLLPLKFNHYVYLSQEGHTCYTNRLGPLLDKLTQFINLQNPKYNSHRSLCQTLLLESPHASLLFSLCPTSAKVQLLHYLSHPPQTPVISNPSQQLNSLIESISNEQFQQVVPWLFTALKELVLLSKAKMNSYQRRQAETLPLFLNILVRHRYQLRSEQRESLYRTVLDLMRKVSQMVKVAPDNRSEIENVLASSGIIQLFGESILFVQNGSKTTSPIDQFVKQLYERSLLTILNSCKIVLLDFLTRFRMLFSQDASIMKHFLQLRQLRQAQPYALSMTLQFSLELLILIQRGKLYYQDQKSSDTVLKAVKELVEDIVAIGTEQKGSRIAFYSLPKIMGRKDDGEDVKRLAKKAAAAAHSRIHELRGGIYFKLVLIVTRLIVLRPQWSSSRLVETLLAGSGARESKMKAVSRALFDFNQPNIQSKERGSAELLMNRANEAHQQHATTMDSPLTPDRFDEQPLTPYLIDYFLMALAEMLQKDGEKLSAKEMRTFTDLIVKACNAQKIGKDLIEQHVQGYSVLDYESLMSAMNRVSRQESKSSRNFSPRADTPLSATYTGFPSNEELQEDAFAELEQRGINRLNSSPNRPRKGSVDLNSSPKKRQEWLSKIQEHPEMWITVCRQIEFSKYFCGCAKKIRQVQLVHQHYVLTNYNKKQQQLAMERSRLSNRFLGKHSEELKVQRQREKRGEADIALMTRKVRRLFPYTSPTAPVLQVLPFTLGNMTSPITQKISVKQYKTKRLKHLQSMNMIHYTPVRESGLSEGTELNDQLLEQMLDKMPSSEQRLSIEKDIFEGDQLSEDDFGQIKYCQWMTREGVYCCEWQWEQNCFKMQPLKNRPSSEESHLWYLRLGTAESNLIPQPDLTPQLIHLNTVKQVLTRKVNQITGNAVEFFFNDGSSKLVSFFTKQICTNFLKELDTRGRKIKIIRDPVLELSDLRATQRWAEGTLSNFDYLMLLNKYGGRTYNDMNQYYVFPWILQDYKSPKIDLSKQQTFRDLSKPIGALNAQRLASYIQKYKMNPTEDRCLYRSHYSTSLFIFFYLIRLEPFSSLHRDMQNAKWDVADRLFHSMENVWQNLVADLSSSDIKQSIPQFYYLPVCLKNAAHIEFGTRQCGSQIDDVVLPPWAGSPEEFIVTMRAALESDWVSQNLHQWIDLIFGKHQCSQEKNNVFHPYTYSDPKVLSQIAKTSPNQLQGIICQINYFGQCPIQLFKKEHRAKKMAPEPKMFRTPQKNKSESTSYQSNQGQVSEYSFGGAWRATGIGKEGLDVWIELEQGDKKQRGVTSVCVLMGEQGVREAVESVRIGVRQYSPASQATRVRLQNSYELWLGDQFLIDLDTQFEYNRVETNQMWICCYGTKGVKVFNWQMEEQWAWTNQEVSQVHLYPTRLFFCTPTGRIVTYSFFDRKLNDTLVLKGSCSMMIQPVMLPRLPSLNSKNVIHCRTMCIADGKRVCLIGHTFEQNVNFTSVENTASNITC